MFRKVEPVQIRSESANWLKAGRLVIFKLKHIHADRRPSVTGFGWLRITLKQSIGSKRIDLHPCYTMYHMLGCNPSNENMAGSYKVPNKTTWIPDTEMKPIAFIFRNAGNPTFSAPSLLLVEEACAL